MSSNGAALARLLGAHPHWLRWVDCAALVEDGVAFSDEGIRAVGGTETTLHSSSGSRRQRGRSRPQGSGKETRSSRTERAAGSKSAHKQRQLSSPTGAPEIEGSGAGEPDERERIVVEQRSADRVHSSQQAIKVVGLSQVTL